MILSKLLTIGEDEIICDLAETYHIYDYKQMPPFMVAIFVCGLKDTSRIKMKYLNTDVGIDRLMMAHAVDSLNFIAWSKTKNAKDGINRPKKFVDVLLGKTNNDKVKKFRTGEEFMKAWNS